METTSRKQRRTKSRTKQKNLTWAVLAGLAAIVVLVLAVVFLFLDREAAKKETGHGLKVLTIGTEVVKLRPAAVTPEELLKRHKDAERALQPGYHALLDLSYRENREGKLVLYGKVESWMNAADSEWALWHLNTEGKPQRASVSRSGKISYYLSESISKLQETFDEVGPEAPVFGTFDVERMSKTGARFKSGAIDRFGKTAFVLYDLDPSGTFPGWILVLDSETYYPLELVQQTPLPGRAGASPSKIKLNVDGKVLEVVEYSIRWVRLDRVQSFPPAAIPQKAPKGMRQFSSQESKQP